MDQNKRKRKQYAHRHPRDWDRRARVINALSARQLKINDLANFIGRSAGYLSAVIWGIDRSYSIETEIATALGKTWTELFSPEMKERAA